MLYEVITNPISAGKEQLTAIPLLVSPSAFESRKLYNIGEIKDVVYKTLAIIFELFLIDLFFKIFP